MGRERKIAILGSRAVGKSSLASQFTEERFTESYYPTIENQLRKTVNYNGIEYHLEVLDTAGQDEFSMIPNKLLIGVSGYILVYSIASLQSFKMLNVVRDKILDGVGAEVGDRTLPVVIVGNKSDLQGRRQVSQDELKQLAASFGGVPYLECSAKSKSNVNQVFEEIVDEINKVEGQRMFEGDTTTASTTKVSTGCSII